MNKVSNRLVEIGDSYIECVERIRNVYGDNYQILNKRECIKTGFLGFGKKKQVEVAYAIKDTSSMYKKPVISTISADTGNSLAAEKERLLAAAEKARMEAQQTQMNEIKKQLETLNKKMDGISAEPETPSTIRKIEDLLEANEFSTSYIREIAARVRSEFSLDELEDFDKVQKRVVEWIGESIQIEAVLELEKKPTIMILVGPTGVGKTTTVAKLGAKFRLSGKDLFIRLVTTDRFRIAAKEQLFIYGKHLQTPTAAAESASDIQEILALDNGQLDLMIIDTIGLSPHDYEGIGRMRQMLEIPSVKPDVYLVISASTKASDLRDIMRNYETFDYKSVIVTKYDETNHIGNIVSVLSEKKKPVSFISSGQIVPKNFEPATVVRFLMKLSDFKIDRDELEKKFGALPIEFTASLKKNTNGGM